MANPVGAILSSALMLEVLGHAGAAMSVEEAVKAVLRRGDTRTPDMGGRSTTSQMGDAVVSSLRGK
jgi:isocitrate/isopropylmalate dehydrogenase